MNQGTSLGSQAARWMVLAALVVLLGALLLSTRPVGAQSSPPGAPTGLTAKAVGTALAELHWTAPVAGRDSITHYSIETSVNNGTSWTTLIADTEVAGGQNTASGVQTHYSVVAAVAPAENLYRVSAVNSVGTGDPSSRVSVTAPVSGTQPDAPTALTAMANGSTEINLAWTAPTTVGSGPITQYKIEYSKNGSLPWMDLATTTVTSSDDGTKYSNTGLAPGTTRHYRVSAVNIAGQGPVFTTTDDPPPSMAKTALAGVPAAPTGLRAVALLVPVSGTNSVELYWTAPNEGRAPIENYRIEYSSDKGETWADTTPNGVPDTEVAGGQNTASGVQTHYAVEAQALSDTITSNLYRVSAINTIGTGPVSATVSVTPPVANTQPSAPQNVAATADGSREIEVTWAAPTTQGVGPVTQYKIEYSKDGNLPWMDLATVSASALKYSNAGLAPDTTRFYRVSAVNKAGRGPVSTDAASAITESATVTSEPGAPTGLTAKAVGTALAELHWTAPVAGRDSITHYSIETSVNNGTSWTTLIADTEVAGGQNTASGVQTHYSVVAAVAPAENLYRVSAVNSVGTGDPSSRVSVTAPVSGTQPDAPTALTAMANGSTEINLAWTAPTTVGSGPITQYKIEYSKNGSLPWMDLATTTVTSSDDGTKYSNTGLAPGTTRHYRVSAVNIAGQGPVFTTTDDPPPSMAKTALAGVPAAPTGLRAVALLVPVSGTNSVELYWTAPNEGRAPIENYRIEYSSDKGETWADTTPNGVPDTEVAGGQNTASGVQTHYAVEAQALSDTITSNLYRVSAINTIGTGPVSATVSVTPPVANTQPSAPRNPDLTNTTAGVAARPDGQNEIDVTWAAPATQGVGPVTQYKIEYSKDGNLPWMEVATVGNVLKYSDTGLEPDTTRFYRVSAVNKAGRGVASATPVVTLAEGATYNTLLTDHVATTDDAAADQMGMVTLSTQAPMVGTAITATLTDADGGVTGQMWQWEKSMDKSSWMDITGAMAMSYTPVVTDMGYYLRVTVTYTDKNRSDRIAQSMATGSVVALPSDQMGTVSLSTQEPLVGEVVTATLTDADGMSNHVWKWQKSTDKTDWMDAAGMGAATAMYTPETADVGNYLRAMVTYDDNYREDREATSDPTTSMVVANNQPTFADGMDIRAVAENTAAGMNVGAPVMATDADADDTLTYSLGDDDAMYFTINTSTGQIMVGEGTMLDYEGEKTAYMVTVTVNDGSGAPNSSASIDVTISVTNVNEKPYFADETATREVAENTAADMPIGDAFGEAMDPDAGDTLTYSLGGDDADSFGFDAETRQISTKAALDYETKSSYSVMVIATDSGELTDSIDVTINVTDVEEGAVQRFDSDGDGNISIAELFSAIDAYFADGISISELFEVIDAYFG